MPTSEPAPLSDRADADELLRHAAWLHALARTLVGEADADDVVQETWVAAIAKPPRFFGSLRSWLGTVARNIVRKRVRDDARRRERELAASRRDPEPAADQVVARAAQMRELVDRVLALDEPYRTTILLRFFEGVKPQEIARRVGASEEAVRQRLRRGLDRLREGLDRDHDGDRESWIAGFAPLVAASAVPAAAAAATGSASIVKGVSMSAALKLAIAGAVVAVAVGVAFMLQSRRETPEIARGDVKSTSEVAAATRPTSAASPTDVEAQREPEGGAAKPTGVVAPTASDTGAPIHFVYGAVVDTSGAIVEGARIKLYAIGAIDPKVPSESSPLECGSHEGAWAAAGLTPARWHVTGWHDGMSNCEREFTVDSTNEGTRLDVVFRTPLTIPVRLRSPDGRPLAEAMKEDAERGRLFGVNVLGLPKEPPARFQIGFVGSYAMAGPGRWFARRGTMLSNGVGEETPIPVDADGVLKVDAPAPRFIAALWKHVTLASAPLVDPVRGVDLIVDPSSIRNSMGSVRLRLVDGETKHAIEVTSLTLNLGSSIGGVAASTDREGVTWVRDVSPGSSRLIFERAGYERLILPFDLDAGAEVDLGTIEVSRPIEVHGRVTRRDGKRPPSSVTFVDLDHGSPPVSSNHSFELLSDGSFVISGFGRGRYLLCARDQDCAPATAIVDLRRDPIPQPELELVAGTPVTIALTRPWPLQMPRFELDSFEGELELLNVGFGPIRVRPGRHRLLARRGAQAVLDLPFEAGDASMTLTIPPIDDPNGLTLADPSTAAHGDDLERIAPKIVGDPIGIVCYGRVLGGETRGLLEGGANFSDARNGRRAGPLHDGCFAVAGLRMGSIERQFLSAARLPFTDHIGLATSPALQRHDFSVARGTTVEITLVDAQSGTPFDRIPENARLPMLIPRFTVIATKEPPPSEVPVLDPDWNFFSAHEAGRFQWQNPDDFRKSGTLDISGELPVFVSLVSGGRVLHTQVLASPVASLRLPVDWGAVRAGFAELRFKLVDATSSEPLAATQIDLVPSNSYPGGRGGSPIPFDADGGYVRTGIPSGVCKLCVQVAGHEALEHEIILPPGRVTDLGTIELGTPKNAKGHVVDAEGHPLRVSIKTLDAWRAQRPVAMRHLAYYNSTDNGSFSVGVGHGLTQLLLGDERFASTCVEVDPASGPLDDLRIVLVPGIPITIRSLPEDQSRQDFTVEDDSGRLVAMRTLTMGSCRLNLRPGKYTAAVSLNGDELARDDFEVKDDPVEVVLKR